MKLLVDGHIPAGEACPWADQCALKMDKCPTREMPRDVPFSCASARAFDLIKTPSGSPLDTIFGKWPGDESDEQIAKALRKIP